MTSHNAGGLMTPATLLGVILQLALGWSTWFFLSEKPLRVDEKEPKRIEISRGNHSSSTPPPTLKPKKEVVLMTIAQLATTLNSPETNVENDFTTLETILREYRRQYQGNPSGENIEISAALMGDNDRGLGFIPKLGKNQINAQGELIDRWGSPYFFCRPDGGCVPFCNSCQGLFGSYS
jgi:hypothetical protein